MTTKQFESLNDLDFLKLNAEDRIAYLNEHNAGTFRLPTEQEKTQLTEYLKRKYKNESNDIYAIREETQDMVSRNNSSGWNGKLSARLFLTVPKSLFDYSK